MAMAARPVPRNLLAVLGQWGRGGWEQGGDLGNRCCRFRGGRDVGGAAWLCPGRGVSGKQNGKGLCGYIKGHMFSSPPSTPIFRVDLSFICLTLIEL